MRWKDRRRDRERETDRERVEVHHWWVGVVGERQRERERTARLTGGDRSEGERKR